MRDKIFITGGSGLLALNWALVVKDKYQVTLGIHSRNISLSGISVAPIDLESIGTIVLILRQINPAIVIHAAGLTSVEKCESEPELAHHVNVTLAENVATACFMLGIKLVHISTDHIFSGREFFLDEESCPTPINVYGYTKAEAESRVLLVNPHALVIRTNFYAWGTTYRHSFSDVIIKTLRAGQSLTLFQDIFYTPILVEVAVEATHKLLKLQASGIFNITGNQRISKYQFGLNIAHEFKLDSNMIISGRFSDRSDLVIRPHDMSLSNKKACDLLGIFLGGPQEHLSILYQQELSGYAEEMGAL